uniref:F-box domain-containing protein n=1 Tax=Steinernema glaseri TaxID=37863 RepID=A0A1I7Z5J2_9BILA
MVFTTALLLFLSLASFSSKSHAVSGSFEDNLSDTSEDVDTLGVTSLIHQCIHSHLQEASLANAALLSACISDNLRFSDFDFDVYGQRMNRRRFLAFSRGTGFEWEDCVALSVGAAGGDGLTELELHKKYPHCRQFALKSNYIDQSLISKVVRVIPLSFHNENVTLTEPTNLGPIFKRQIRSKLVQFLIIHTVSDWLVEAIHRNYFADGGVICQVALLRSLIEDSHFTPIFATSVGRNAIEMTLAHLGQEECEEAFGFSRYAVQKKLPPIEVIENKFFPKDDGWDPDRLTNGLI